MQDAPRQWESWRRSLDYYEEEEMNWLWADTIIRQQTHGQNPWMTFVGFSMGLRAGHRR